MKLDNISYKHIIRTCCLALFFLGMSVQMHAQNISVTGTVTDERNEPLTGVTVKVEGNATQGTMTDIDGRFELNCPAGSVLEFSYIGFNSLKATAERDMKIVLSENAIALKETVIVGIGYGTMRKSDLTGSIASVGQEDLKKGVVTSAEQVLQGKISGLSVVQSSGDPSAGASIRLRGGTSLAASNSPLIVVDGIPGVDINTVQPSEILSIDVLKDASSAAIYGSRGANGVIIITTSRSSDREARSIQYNGYAAAGYVPKHLDFLTAGEWRSYVKDNNIANYVDNGGDTDWQKELERTAFTHSHNLYFSNVGKDSGYSASITYLNSQGVMKESSMNRIAGSVSAHQYGLNRRLKLEAGVTGSRDNWNPFDNRVFERIANQNPTTPVYDENGNFTQIAGTNTENPLEIAVNRNASNSRTRLLGYGKIELTIIDGLKASANGSYEYNSLQTRFYVPTYAKLDGETEKGRGQRNMDETRNMQLETFLTYDKDINKDNRLNVMGGYSYLEYVTEGFGAVRRGFDTDEFSYNNLAAGSDIRQGDVSSYRAKANLVSFFGRVNYSLMNKYMLTATVRNDGSSRFGDNNKWGWFPSVSAAWRVSEESFMEGTSSWLDNLKLRLGYGVTGNQGDIGEYKSLPLLTTTSYMDPSTGLWVNSYIPAQNSNPDLKWESTQQFNLGIDFSLFNRVTGSIELYSKKTKDLLWTYLVAQPSNLRNTMLANVGTLSNKGVELTLGSNIIKTKDFSWDANMTFSYNDQEITKLSNSSFSSSGFAIGSLHGLQGFSGIYSQRIMEGYPLGAFYGPKCSGIDAEGKYIFENKDANGNPVDEYLGSAQPKVNLGIAMNFAYRHFDMNISGYGMFGQKVLNGTAMALSNISRVQSQNILKDLSTSGISSKQDPKFSSYWIENGSFFRLQSITLGYTLPFEMKKVGFEKIRFYVTGENLFVISGYSGIDPEVRTDLRMDSNGDVTASPGIDRFDSYPRPTTFSFGVNLSF
ncbi:TonB-linked SusC/RagA family outer membrane protein [Dysgonomonas sp. PFB1-18]|uniref:SusC/RagA family TonB-linked outer membrane protein n=1 Tax=unclassified Dysgonomonas TaxID=2630389 RepID=UPI00247369E4|nr:MULTISPECIES: TonB-dependent receptor [unclassified Dysgonomonas]MDH6310441.1 TonB-linked SusC/RagA family outer membrane protein [Dysgonomonas sp. PF1-14]MDH6340752.1 TonB-linked SusC/RagA family outer membrane protein [Dysgonomonas sp. PF1-16]MDH6382372.1 TonB-linked SusC/RagA family outer membrane protein [Dysgonomonas sp. PFB1-18]MDH6399727.1 TonB-linked SusC/RagA family outer membrane protein [Dysgonomonas sp. PF1-23]